MCSTLFKNILVERLNSLNTGYFPLVTVLKGDFVVLNNSANVLFYKYTSANPIKRLGFTPQANAS